MHYVLPRSILENALSVGDGIDQALSCATELCRTHDQAYIVIELVGASFPDCSQWMVTPAENESTDPTAN